MITRTINLFPAAILTTTTNGTAMTGIVGPSLPLAPAASSKHGAADMKVFFETSIVTATQATLDFSVQGRPVAGTGSWFTLQPLVGSASLAWVQVSTATSLQVRRFAGPIPAEIRGVMTTASTNPNYTAGAYAVLGE